MTIDELVNQSHATALDHGFYDGPPPNFGEKIALMHSELSESLEEFRAGRNACYLIDEKPEGWAVELADVVIRIADTFGYYGLDLMGLLSAKMAYNKTRPYKHGKAF